MVTRPLCVVMGSAACMFMWSSALNAQTTPTEPPAERSVTVETTEVETTQIGLRSWDIDAPVRLRAADPQAPCTLELHTIFDYSTSSDGSDDDARYIGLLKWGFMPDHELFLRVPVELGDGEVDGNADATLGWHWRLWEETDVLPAFALVNSIRIPNGYHSSGVDWTLLGAFTKSIVADCFRVHFNPFLKSVNGDNIESNAEGRDRVGADFEDQRHFQWGAVIGVDWRLNECLVLTADYVHEASELKGWRNQHSAELGLEYELSENQEIAMGTRVGLDGDTLGDNWGLALNYIYTFDYSD